MLESFTELPFQAQVAGVSIVVALAAVWGYTWWLDRCRSRYIKAFARERRRAELSAEARAESKRPAVVVKVVIMFPEFEPDEALLEPARTRAMEFIKDHLYLNLNDPRIGDKSYRFLARVTGRVSKEPDAWLVEATKEKSHGP